MLLLLISLLAASAAAQKNQTFQAVSGSVQRCVGGRTHQLDYSAEMVSANKFVDLDQMADKLDTVTCDIDHTRLSIRFKKTTDAVEWLVKFHDLTNDFIVGGERWGCSSQVSAKYARSGFILRRVIAASETAHLGKTLNIVTTMARYDEIFSSADIAYGVTGAAGSCESADLPICLGYNTKCDGAPSSSIPLYTGTHITASCSDCFADIEADAFVNVSIRDFHLTSLAGGFKNVNMNASMVLDVQASAQWNVGVDKTLPLVQDFALIDFSIASVPFMLFFDLNAETVADLQFNTAAELVVGTNAGVALGDAYVTWTPEQHWKHTTMTFVPSFTSQLRTSASLDMSGSMGFTPTFNLHFDQIFDYQLQANPNINAEVQGSEAERRVCLTSSMDMDLTTTTSLHINIPLINYHQDWQWGPTVVGSWSGIPIPKHCHNWPNKTHITPSPSPPPVV